MFLELSSQVMPLFLPIVVDILFTFFLCFFLGDNTVDDGKAMILHLYTNFVVL